MFLLTAFSPAMFKNATQLNIKPIKYEQARELIDPETTTLITNRISTGAMVNRLFGNMARSSRRSLTFRAGDHALVVHYRGPVLTDDGIIPSEGVVTFYELEVA